MLSKLDISQSPSEISGDQEAHLGQGDILRHSDLEVPQEQEKSPSRRISSLCISFGKPYPNSENLSIFNLSRNISVFVS